MLLLHLLRPSATCFLLLAFLLAGLTPRTATGQTRNNIAELVHQHRQRRAFPETTFFQRPQHRVSDVTRDRIDRSLTSATVVTLNKIALKNVRQSPEKALALALPYQDRTLQLDLVEVELFAEDFTLTTPESGPEGIPYQPGRYYRGIVRGDDQSLVALSVFENEVRGIVSTQADGNINIVPVAQTALPAADGAPAEYVIFSDRMAKSPRDFHCGTPEGAALPPSNKKPADQPDSDWTQKYVGVFFECDYDLFVNRGGINETFNYVTALFNGVAAIYFNERINVRITGIFVWTIKDPYSKDCTEESLPKTLSEFRKERRYENGSFSFHGNLAHLLLLRPCPGSNSFGYATIRGLCTGKRFGFTQLNGDGTEFPEYSWDVSTVAHEIGHGFGSEESHWCGWPGGPIDNCEKPKGDCNPGPATPDSLGTIMSYCSKYSLKNGFGPLPGDTIRHFVYQADCLYSISGSCPTPVILDAYSNTSCQAEIDWTPVAGAQEYQIRYRSIKPTTGDWIYKNKIVSQPYTLQGLKPGVIYDVQVMAYCGLWAMSLYSPSYTFSTYCPNPYGLQTVLVTDHNAKIKWNADPASEPYSGSYGIRYRRVGTGEWTVEATSQKEFILQNLAPDAIYECQVNTICKCGGSEPAIVLFRTEPPCPAPTGLTVSQVTGYSAVLNWTPVPEANYYTINYRRMFSSESTTVSVAGPPVKLQNLIVGSIYEVWVSSDCTLSPNSKGSSYTSVSTMNPLCGHPSDPWATNITTTGATINWAWITTNLSHTIWYRADGDSVWQTKLINGIQAVSGALTGLLPGTTYKYFVLKRCSNGASPSIVQTFTTLSAGQAPADRTADTWSEQPDTGVQLLLSPNPAGDRCRFELPDTVLPEPGRLEIRDLLGRVWVQTEWPAFAEAMDLNVSALPAGTYMVFLSGAGLRTGRPLVVGR